MLLSYDTVEQPAYQHYAYMMIGLIVNVWSSLLLGVYVAMYYANFHN